MCPCARVGCANDDGVQVLAPSEPVIEEQYFAFPELKICVSNPVPLVAFSLMAYPMSSPGYAEPVNMRPLAHSVAWPKLSVAIAMFPPGYSAEG